MREQEYMPVGFHEVVINDGHDVAKVYNEQQETAKFYNKNLAYNKFHQFCKKYATPDENNKKKRIYGVITQANLVPIRLKTGEIKDVIRGKVATPYNNWKLSFQIFPAQLQLILNKEIFEEKEIFDKEGVLISTEQVISDENVQLLVDMAFNCEIAEYGAWFKANLISQR